MESPILHAFFLLVKNQCGRLGGCHGCWTVSFPPGPGSRPSQGGREGTVTELSAETTQRYFQVSGDSQDQGDQGEVLPAEPGARRQRFRGPTPCTTPNPEPEAGKRAARPPLPARENDSHGSWKAPSRCVWVSRPRGRSTGLWPPPPATRGHSGAANAASPSSPPVLVASPFVGHTPPLPPVRTCTPEA